MRDHAFRVRWRGALLALSIAIGVAWVRAPIVLGVTAPFQQQDPRLDEASRLFEQALALRKDGKLREGVAAAEKAAALVEQVRGAEHLDTAGALMKLGALQFAVPNYAGAARTFERALSIYEK